MTGAWLDRLARALVDPRPRTPVEAVHAAEGAGEPTLGRAELLRRGALGGLVLAGVGAFRVSPAAAAPLDGLCVGGSNGACLKAAKSYVGRILSGCGNTSAESVVDSILCYRSAASERSASQAFCRRHCPQPKKKKKPPGQPGSGGGPGPPPPPGGGGGSANTCGEVSCVRGDKCCPQSGVPGNRICCAIGCAKGGQGCCSSDSDCG